jgi:hypothetical protein
MYQGSTFYEDGHRVRVVHFFDECVFVLSLREAIAIVITLNVCT